MGFKTKVIGYGILSVLIFVALFGAYAIYWNLNLQKQEISSSQDLIVQYSKKSLAPVLDLTVSVI